MPIRIVDNHPAWSQVLDKISHYDCYSTYDYHALAASMGEGVPELLVFEHENEGVLAIPFLKRSIPEDATYYDYTSVYGYAGPLCSVNAPSTEFLTSFWSAFKSYCLERRIVSVFSRLHPLIDPQEAWLNELGELKKLGNTVQIDLTLSLEEQWRKHKKSKKHLINRLRKSNTIKEANEPKEIQAFIDIYHQNMERVSAAERYFFPEAYFHQLLQAKDFKTKIYLAMDGQTVMGAAMFFFTNNIVQYHLAGTREEYLKQAPMYLILDHARREAIAQGYHHLHLGGGLGAKEDALFKFKAGFSDIKQRFKVWNYIVNPEKYDRLVRQRGVDATQTDFFPLYRA